MLQLVLPSLIVMVVAFTLGYIFLKRFPLGLLLAISAVLATLISGLELSARHIVEGTFVYFNVILVCITGMIFLQVVEGSGAVTAISRSLTQRLYRFPVLLITVIMLLLLVPGMLTGVAVTAVLSVGVVVSPILIVMGIPPVVTAAIIAIGAALSMVAPPTNLLAMIIAHGINAPFEGMGLPSFLLSVPLAIIIGLALGIRYVKVPTQAELEQALPEHKEGSKSVLCMSIPFIVVFGLLILVRIFPFALPDPGTPLIFMIGAIVGLFTGQRVSFLKSAQKALTGPMITVIEILIGVGIFVQLATLTGVRGLLVVSSLSLPYVLAYFAASGSLFFGSGILSPFGSASIFGVPFALYFLDKNQIIVIVALSLLAAIGQLAPPAAIAGRFSAQLTKVDSYAAVLKKAAVWMVLTIIIGIVVIVYSDQLARLLGI